MPSVRPCRVPGRCWSTRAKVSRHGSAPCTRSVSQSRWCASSAVITYSAMGTAATPREHVTSGTCSNQGGKKSMPADATCTHCRPPGQPAGGCAGALRQPLRGPVNSTSASAARSQAGTAASSARATGKPAAATRASVSAPVWFNTTRGRGPARHSWRIRSHRLSPGPARGGLRQCGRCPPAGCAHGHTARRAGGAPAGFCVPGRGCWTAAAPPAPRRWRSAWPRF